MTAAEQVLDAQSATQVASAEKLRDELIECHKIRADFLKWKLVLIAVLGGAALSVKVTDTNLDPAARTLVLLLIPFVCVYADLMCLQNALRAHSITRFICQLPESAPGVSFERRLAKGEAEIFSLERFALFWSTLLIDITVAFGGLLHPGAQTRTWVPDAFQVFAAAGVVLTVFVGAVFISQMGHVATLFPIPSPPPPARQEPPGKKAANPAILRLVIGFVVPLALIFLLPPLLASGR
jgi:hypothetical protein